MRLKHFIFLLLCCTAGASFAVDYYVNNSASSGTSTNVSSPGNVVDTIRAVGPGDTVYFRGGTYTDVELKVWSSYVANGESDNPIECKPYNNESVLFDGHSGINCLEVNDRSYWIFRDFEFTGYSNAIKFNGASYILIDGCHIHHTASVCVGFKLDTHHVTFKNCELNNPGGTGEIFYIGNSSDYASHICHENVIKNCLLHDTFGTSQGDGIEMKPLCWGNIVRDNVIYNTDYPAVYSWGNGNRALAPNIVEGNVIYNATETGIEVGTGTIVRNNVIFNCDYPAINIRSKTETQSGGRIYDVLVLNNTMYNNNQNIGGSYRGEIHVNHGLEMRDCIFANNVFYITNSNTYAISIFDTDEEPHNTTQFLTNRYYKPSNSQLFYVELSTADDIKTFAEWQSHLASHGVTDGDDDSTVGNPGFANAASTVPGADFYLSSNITGTTLAEVPYDIEGRVRSTPPTVGAYEWESTGSTQWGIQEDFKPFISGSGGAGWDPDLASTQVPLVSLAANPTSGDIPLTVDFTCTASDPDGGSIVSYSWDYGDGSGTGAGQSPSHSFTVTGTYTVACQVVDDESEVTIKEITIYAGTAPPSSGGGSDSGGGCGSGAACLLCAGAVFYINNRKRK